MDLRQLHYFTTIIDTGSFLAAARKLNLSQPALSKRIQELEATLLMRLLDRHSRGVTLTAAGRELAGRARAILASVEETRQAMAVLRAQPRTIRFGVTPATAITMLPQIIERCDSLAAPLYLDVQQRSTQEVLDLVANGHLDGAMSFDLPAQPTQFMITPLHNEDLMLIGPPDVVDATAGDIRLKDLHPYPLILGPLTELTRYGIDAAIARAGIALNVRNHIQPITVRRSLMLQNGFCSIMLFSSLASEIQRGELAVRRVVDPVLPVTLYLILRIDLPTEAREGLARIVRQLSAETMAGAGLPWYPAESRPPS